MRSTCEAHQDQQKLTASEEEVLVHFLEESADQGFPQSIEQITTLATTVCHARLGPDCPEIGGSWAGHFLNRHCAALQTHWSKSLDTQRARSMNPEAKKGWFKLLEDFVVKLGIRCEDLYAMDKSGCPPSDQGTQQVVGQRGTKTQHLQGWANRKNVTSIVTICANGSVLDRKSVV